MNFSNGFHWKRTGIQLAQHTSIRLMDYLGSTSTGGISGLILGFGGGLAGGGGAGVNQSSGASSRTQRTLTIIIKFADSAVKEFTYNSTSF